MKLTRVFLDVHLGQGFEGLSKIAKAAKSTPNEENTLVFINRRNTAFKMLRAKDYLIYYKNGNQKIPIEAIRHLPETFGGTRTEFEGAIKKVLQERLGLFE